MRAVRKLIHDISTAEEDAKINIASLCLDAMHEVEAVEETFPEIAKLQQRILGDSKPIGGTAHNKQSTPLCTSCGSKTCSMQAGVCAFWEPIK